jgi:hypothetical protein
MGTGHDPDEAVVEGITAWAELLGDAGLVRTGTRRYRDVAPAIRGWLPPGWRCSFAFASVLAEPDGDRRRCFVAVLTGDLVVAWRRGRFRSGVQSIVVPLPSIRSARDDTGAGRFGELAWLRVDSARPVVLGLPAHRPDVVEKLRRALLAGRTSRPDRVVPDD